MTNCRGCKNVVDSRDSHRRGIQFRCGKAEELFGGERWVDDLPVSTCGYRESIVEQVMTEEEAKELVTPCDICKDKGTYTSYFGHEVYCYICDKENRGGKLK